MPNNIATTSYPIKKIDNLGRIVHITWNDSERTVNTYWTDSNNIKIKYKYYNKDVSFDAYLKNGQNIICYNGTRLDIKLDFLIFNTYWEGFNFKIDNELKKQWIQLIRKVSEKPVNSGHSAKNKKQ